MAEFSGDERSDEIRGGSDRDLIFGEGGNDDLHGGAGDDDLHGGAGDDALFGDEGSDFLEGGAGIDRLDGGDGFDYASYLDHRVPVVVSLAAGLATLVDQGQLIRETLVSIEAVYGGGGDDTLFGDDAYNRIFGSGGNDLIDGGAGDDFLWGDLWDGAVWGDSSNDAMYSGGDDAIYGGAGDDDLRGGGGDDTLFGGAGSDFLEGGTGNDWLDGGDGFDYASYLDHQVPLFASLVEGRVSFVENTGLLDETLISIEAVYGGDGNDTLLGDDAYNRLFGSGGNDFLDGRAGDDFLWGDDGDDDLRGGDGDDTISGGEGSNHIDGGTGYDVAEFHESSDHYRLGFSSGEWTLSEFVGTERFDTLVNIELLRFLDNQVIIESRNHASYTALPEALWQFFVVAFNATPGVTYMDQIAEAFNFGLSIKEIVDIFTTKIEFTSTYPTTLTDQQLASALVNNIVKDSATANAKQSAVDDIAAALSIGWSVGDVIFNVFGNLANKPLTDAAWGNTAKQFHNEITVAMYYTNTMNQSTDDLDTLRDVIAGVTQSSDLSSDGAIAALIGVALIDG